MESDVRLELDQLQTHAISMRPFNRRQRTGLDHFRSVESQNVTEEIHEQRQSSDDVSCRTELHRGQSLESIPEAERLLPVAPSQLLLTYSQKASICDRQLDAFGMGKYQWCIFALCGCGYFLDLMYAQAFGLIEPAIQQEFGFSDSESGNLFSAFSIGLTIGALAWGAIVDVIGRRYAFNLTVLLTAIFGFCLALPSSYSGVLVLAVLLGFGIGGNIPIDTIICLEFLPSNRRSLLATLSIFQPLGVLVSAGIASALIPKFSCDDNHDGHALKACGMVPTGSACCSKSSNMGWRYHMIVLGTICLLIFILRFCLFNFQESPKFLLLKDRPNEAHNVLRHIAAFNGQENMLHEDLSRITKLGAREAAEITADENIGSKLANCGRFGRNSLNKELERYNILFASRKQALTTVLLWVVYAFDYWGFSLAGSFLPKIMLAKNVEKHVAPRDTYQDLVIVFSTGMFGVMGGSFLYSYSLFGRKLTMILSSALMAASLMLFATINSRVLNVLLNAVEYFFQSMFNAVLYGWTPEIFPAQIRGTACGLASFWGRLFSIIAPLVGAQIMTANLNAPLYLAGSGVLVSTFAITLIPAG